MSSQATAFYRTGELREWGGFPENSGIYGGNEAFMAMRTWMMGKEVWSDPRISYSHLADTRGYSMNNRLPQLCGSGNVCSDDLPHHLAGQGLYHGKGPAPHEGQHAR